MREWWHPSPHDPPMDVTLSRLRRALPRLRRHTTPQPWHWERLATPEEMDLLKKTIDVRSVA